MLVAWSIEQLDRSTYALNWSTSTRNYFQLPAMLLSNHWWLISFLSIPINMHQNITIITPFTFLMTHCNLHNGKREHNPTIPSKTRAKNQKFTGCSPAIQLATLVESVSHMHCSHTSLKTISNPLKSSTNNNWSTEVAYSFWAKTLIKELSWSQIISLFFYKRHHILVVTKPTQEDSSHSILLHYVYSQPLQEFV